MSSISEFILRLIYPPLCPLCDSFVAERDRACKSCAARLIAIEADANIELDVKTYLARVRSCFAFEDPVRKLIHAFKYSGRIDAVGYLANSLCPEADSLKPFDLVAAVPMGRERLVSRGFDPTALLARRLAKISCVPFSPRLLRRSRSVPPQVGLEREERVRNVRGAFAVCPGLRVSVRGKRILLIDDVLTTGATLNDCARALAKAGAGEVSALTLARTL